MPDTRARHDIHVSSAILGAAGLTQAEKMVYIAIRSRQGDGPGCFAKQATLAADIGSARAFIGRTIRKLFWLGWISKADRFLRCNDERARLNITCAACDQRAHSCDCQSQQCDQESQACDQESQPSESQHLKPKLKDPPAPAREAGSPGGDRKGPPPEKSPPSPDPPPGRALDLSFLTVKDEPQAPAIRHAADKSEGSIADPYWLAALSRSAWGRRNALTPHDARALLRKHSAPVALSAVVIAGDDNNPTRNFLYAIAQRLHEQKQRTDAGQPAENPVAAEAGEQHRRAGSGPLRRGGPRSRADGALPAGVSQGGARKPASKKRDGELNAREYLQRCGFTDEEIEERFASGNPFRRLPPGPGGHA